MSANLTDRAFVKLAQVGEYGSTAAVNPSGEVANMHSRVITVPLPADAAAATATAEYPVVRLPLSCKVKEVMYVPSALVTLNAANYATLTLSQRNAAGGAQLTVAALNTSATSPAAFTGTPLALTAANVQAVVGGCLTLAITKAGTGVQLPQGHLEILVEEN